MNSPPAPRTPARRHPDRTRQTLLECAFEEIHRAGFRAASVDAILESSGVTKGALYHHFSSKTGLGHAVVDEVIGPWIETMWRPILDAENAIDAAIEVCHRFTALAGGRGIECGCPFNNLIVEMSPVDEGFRQRLQKILDAWREGCAQSLRQNQARGLVRADIQADDAAAFILSAVEGCVGLAKAKRSREFLESGMRGLIVYLESLRASGATAATSSPLAPVARSRP